MDIKCNKCEVAKPEAEFHWHTKSKGIRQRVCKVCRKIQYQSWWNEGHGKEKWKATQKVSRRARVLELRKFIQELKSSSPCTDCGGFFHFSAMDFDHVRGEKYRGISELVSLSMRSALMEELEKCELVCANCHRVRTYLRGEHNRVEFSDRNL